MQGMKNFTKKELLELIEKNFPDDNNPTADIATLFYNGPVGDVQQCIIFSKEMKY